VQEPEDVHERAIGHARAVAPDLFQETYVLYEEPSTGYLHGISSCATSAQRKVALTVEEILALPLTGEECECGGWRSTEFFPALLIAHRSWELQRIVNEGGIEEVAEALEQIDRMQPWWRPELEHLGVGLAAAASLSRENYRIELELIEDFAARLDPSPLLRYVAAHGLRTINDVDGAREFSGWVDSLSPRLTLPAPRVVASRSMSPIRPQAVHRPPVSRSFSRTTDARRRFDELLDEALAGPRSVVMLERRLWSSTDGATWYMPAEVLLLSFTQGNSPRSSFAWFDTPRVVVDGLCALLSRLPGPPRMGVLASSALPSTDARTVAETLWSDNDGTWGTLDDVIAAALALDSGRDA